MILVTGAAGKTGRAVIRALATRGEDVRALVHRPEQARLVEELGAREAIADDMRDLEAVKVASWGARAVYHICPNVSPDEVAMGETAVAAACSAGVARFVFHSVLQPQVEEMPHHWAKMRVEEGLIKSGLDYTILQPAAYMQNVLSHWARIVEEGVYPVPYSAETQLSLVDLEDVAAVAALVLTERNHGRAIYELVGTEGVTPKEVAAIFSRHLGRPIRVDVVARDLWAKSARTSGLGDYHIRVLLAMFRYYERYGFIGNPGVLTWLLGRPSTSFAQFIRRQNGR